MKRIVLLLVTLSVFFLAGASIASAQDTTDIQMNYQGHLTDSEGNPLTGNYNMTFSICDSSEEGTILWAETVSVQVEEGHFSLILGSLNPIPVDVLVSKVPYKRWLQVLVGPEMIEPRTQLTFSPYSAVATRVRGKDINTGPGYLRVGDTTKTPCEFVVDADSGFLRAYDDLAHTSFEVNLPDSTVFFGTNKDEANESGVIMYNHFDAKPGIEIVHEGTTSVEIDKDGMRVNERTGDADHVTAKGIFLTVGVPQDTAMILTKEGLTFFDWFEHLPRIEIGAIGMDPMGDAMVMYDSSGTKTIQLNSDYGSIHATGEIKSGGLGEVCITIDGENDEIRASSGTISFDDDNIVTTGNVEMGGFKLSTGASSDYVLTSNASGVGTWQAAAAAQCSDCDDRFVNVQGPDSIRGNTTSDIFRIRNYGNGDALNIRAIGGTIADGIVIDSAGDNGIEINDVGNWGIWIDDTHNDGIYITDAADDGIYIANPSEDGVEVYNAGGQAAFKATNPDTHGVYIYRAGRDGLHIDSTYQDGIYMDDCGDDGIDVKWADDNGIWVSNAGDKGIDAMGKHGNELWSGDTLYYGLYVHSYLSSSTRSGLRVFGTFSVTGTKSSVVQTSQGEENLYAIETPDVEFMASGHASLVNGKAEITFERLFREAISTDVPSKIILTPKGGWSGLYVSEQSSTGFAVLTGAGEQNIDFDWMAIGRRKGYEARPLPQVAALEPMEREELEVQKVYNPINDPPAEQELQKQVEPEQIEKE